MNSVCIQVNNIKCGGCAHNIKHALLSVECVMSVNVNIAEGSVGVSYEGADRRSDYVRILAKAGYPEKETSSFMQVYSIRKL
ncbi:MAG: copper chaperone [Saprospiraceae bacterium]|jgi:copper chaperone